MGSPRQQIHATALSVALVTTMIAGVTLFGAAVAPAAADQHTFDEAPDLTEEADLHVEFPNADDHYPGSMNEEGGSIQYFAAGDDAFEEVGAEEGAYLDMVIISADWIDYSACATDNTEAFGIDRGNNNEGTQFDEDLLDRMERNNFRDDGLDVFFYEFEDFAGDPPYMAPEDAIVAAQGDGSSAGPCLTLTDEPGWYQIQGFTNGTVADNGPDEEPSENADDVGIKLRSNYLYVCECDSEEEAREELGAPPGEDPENGEDEDTPTPTPTPEPVNGDDTPTPTEPPEDTPTPTDAPEDTPTPTEPPEDTPTPTEADDGTNGGQDPGDDPMTPAPDGQTGFGSIVAVLALLASALLAYRRR